VALIATYNEADIIEPAIRDLLRQGIRVYVLDDGSTDDTVRRIEPYIGRGVLAVERLDRQRSEYAWATIVARKEALARELEADWFICHDADEFRESPWPGVDLRPGIGIVDRLGYNAIDFAVLNFPPTADTFVPGTDVREVFRYYEPAPAFDRTQIKCWKRGRTPVRLEAGGHDVTFDGRRVFPLKFLLRHYPVRGEAHGRRKVFEERRPRFAAGERAMGWHVQYDGVSVEDSFLRDAGSLIAYDPDAVRLELALNSRDVEALESARAEAETALAAARAEAEDLRQRVATLGGELDDTRSRAREAERRAGELLASRTWRWSAPVRRLVGRWMAAR
jgi:hypothetical protein